MADIAPAVAANKREKAWNRFVKLNLGGRPKSKACTSQWRRKRWEAIKRHIKWYGKDKAMKIACILGAK